MERYYLSKEGSLFLCFIVIILCLYFHIRKLCQFSMGKYYKNKHKENPQSAKARHLHFFFFFQKYQFSHTKENFAQNKVFNLYQLDILNNLFSCIKLGLKLHPQYFF